MAGEQTQMNVEAAARASAQQAGALKRVADGFSPDPGWAQTFDKFQQEMDAAGHKVGGGWDGCEVCKKMASQLPQLIVQLRQQEQAQQAAKSGGQPAPQG